MATDIAGSIDSGRASRVVISASLAYDLIMTFPGSFKDHILADKAHVLSVSFLVDSLRKRRGGVAGNIAYNLALLGELPSIVGAAGADFSPYRAAFDELGIDTAPVLDVPGEFTASCFINSDLDGNQIVAFYPGALAHVDDLSIAALVSGAEIGLVGATTPVAMRRHAEEIAEAGVRLVYDPSQQVVTLGADDLAAGIARAWAVIGNDYELAIIGQKTGIAVKDLVDRVPFLAVTYGDKGSELFVQGSPYQIPAVPAEPLADPTGGGDAYRAGLLRGILLGVEPAVIGRMAALTATYAIERHGTQEHEFTPDGFVDRFDRSFPSFAGAISSQQLRRTTKAVAGALA
jgi:adenosine kinase